METESRQEDLAYIGQEATKPLLRQIESLQTQYNVSLKDWESLEKIMSVRLKEAETSRATLVERERHLLEQMDNKVCFIVYICNCLYTYHC
jgi:hypothetical protein